MLVVSATDSDVGVNAQITYSLSSEISNEAVAHHDQEFSINPQTGAITTNKLLDRETMSGKNILCNRTNKYITIWKEGFYLRNLIL